jgi:signal transduction histidine kinase
MNRTKLTGRTAFRLAAIFAAIISLTNVLIFSILYFVISQQLSEHLKAHVNEVRKTLVDVGESSGREALAKMVSRHASVAESDEDIFLLTDKSNNYIAGNIQPIERFEGWRTIDWQQLPLIGEWTSRRSSTAVTGRWTDAKDGYLFVGDGNGDINDAQTLLLNGLVWGIAISILAAVTGGLILGFNAQKRIGAIERALNAVASGQLEKRVPRSSAKDDLDHVASLINATLDRLQKLISSLKQVSSDIAHDLRTPISRMRQKLEIAQQSSTDLQTYRATVDDALLEIDGIAETFEALLRISEIEAGARKTRFVDVDLNSLLTNVTDALTAVAEERGHRIVTMIDQSRHETTFGDRQLLSQLFINLIENSIEHCPESAEITVELRNDLGHPAVKISDNGPGIPAEERERVFRRLYRLEKSRSTRGSGLGLSLVAAIAALHDAKISLADNKPGLITLVSFS